MQKNHITLTIGIILVLVLVIVLIIYNSRPINYSVIELPTSNWIKNQSSRNYLDTVVSVGMKQINIGGCQILIRDLDEELKNNFKTNGIELRAAVFGSNKFYVIYVDPSINKIDVITVISHELIHLKQYENKDLVVIDASSGLVKWKGEEIQTLDLEYNLRPWEVEAFRGEKELSDNIYSILFPN